MNKRSAGNDENSSGSGSCDGRIIAQNTGDDDLDIKLPPEGVPVEIAETVARRELPLPLGGVLPKWDIKQPRKLNPVEKKKRRIMANRKSAKESRDRRRQMIAELSIQAHLLSTNNEELTVRNRQMRGEVHDLKRQLEATLTFIAARRERERSGLLLSQQTELGLPVPNSPFSPPGQFNMPLLHLPPAHADGRMEPPAHGGGLPQDWVPSPSLWEISNQMGRFEDKHDPDE